MLLSTRWSDRRCLGNLGAFMAALTTFIVLYSWLAPYPVPLRRMTSMTGVEHRMFAEHAIGNTVVMVPVNTGMIKFADNLLCSLQTTGFDTSKIVFWALDEGAEDILERRGHATFRDPMLYGVSDDSNYSGGTPQYRKMMQERPKFYMDLLATGYDMLMIDADTIFWQSPEVIIPDKDSSIDIVFSTDAREFYQDHNAFKDVWARGGVVPPVCNGLFWMRSTPHTIGIWRDMEEFFESGWRTALYRLIWFQDDQRGMDVLLNDGRAQLVPPLPGGISADMIPHQPPHENTINVQLLDQTQVVNGHLLKNRRLSYDKYLDSLRADGKERIAAHFNWDSSELTKEAGARKFGMYFLDDEGRCQLNK